MHEENSLILFFTSGFITAPSKVSDSPLLTQQIDVLRTALRMKSSECSQLVGDKMIQELKVRFDFNLIEEIMIMGCKI